MWAFIISEISYMRILGFSMLALLPLVFILQTAMQDIGNIPVLAILFILTQNWNTYRNKERREYFYACLPVAKYKIATARILIVLIYSFSVGIFYDLLTRFVGNQAIAYVIPALVLAAIIILGFALYFILRDLLLAFLRRIGLTANRMILILTVLALAFNILGVFAFIQAKNSPEGFAWLGTIIEGFKNNNPFIGDVGGLVFLGASIVFAVFSIISYINRKFYLE